MKAGILKIVVVDDSAIFRKLLVHLLEMDHGFTVSGTATNGAEAIELIRNVRPDVVLMDINMPGMDGFETTTEIMCTTPTPVIIISGDYNSAEVAKTFRALEVGAVDIMPKPPSPAHPDFKTEMSRMITRIRLMAEVKVIRRAAIPRKKESPAPYSTPARNNVTAVPHVKSEPAIIGIGASAGGPIVIQQILKGLSPGVSIPIVMVQHIEPAFTEGFAQWLEQTTGRRITIATDGMKLSSNMIVLPPPDRHLGFRMQHVLEVSPAPPERGLRPSVNHLFDSLAAVYGSSALGIILTGMGADGATGLKKMLINGAVTIAQDFASSMIHGMPGEAIKAEAARYVFSPDQMIEYLNGIGK